MVDSWVVGNYFDHSFAADSYFAEVAAVGLWHSYQTSPDLAEEV